ncbi:hypothetical protein AN5096.2 [Aspergillus nidulans FGSC A4]|nr:hypothetical protein AN5096.2 [Aspergillus nidulans FGSC A4]|eukprot:XP_662700.1 hypothetical protein AN5096.2 [Aspergillus nidulans FGSC A4]
MVITDRLTKGVILEGMSEIDSESVAWALVRVLISKHGIPKAITSDRGSQFTRVSPFYLSHGYNLSPFSPTEEVEQLAEEPAKSPIQKGEAIVRKVKEALDWAQASMAYSQQNAENQANKHRSLATNYQVGDKVWLSLKNICTDRPSKKLDWKNAKYEVIGLVGSHAVRLNTPPGIYPVFHVDLLRLASSDLLPSQKNDDTQPPGIIVNGEKEYMVEKILDERPRRYGRGHRLEYLVKWSGYARPTWEAATALEEAQALDEWLDHLSDSAKACAVLKGGWGRFSGLADLPMQVLGYANQLLGQLAHLN